MTNYDDIQKRLQRGSSQIQEANNLIAEAHGVIGGLVSANEQFKAVAFDQEAGRQAMEGEIAQLKAENEALRNGAACVDDLSALVRQLVQRLRKAAPDNDLPEKALDYLKRKGLQGSPLRSDSVGVEPDLDTPAEAQS